MNAIDSARIVFAGTPEFAVPCLEQLMEAAVVDSVLTQPDRPAGRGRQLRQSPVKEFAGRHDLPVLQPSVLDDRTKSLLPEQRPDLLVVVAYGLILPQWMLDWPRIAPLNVHASLLPRWRGAAPIQRALLEGDQLTGVSLMRIERGLDSGPVYAKRETEIGSSETAGELHDRLARLGAGLLAETLPAILTGSLSPIEQDEARVTHAPKIDKREAMLDWEQSAEALARRVRAFNPWPVAETLTSSGSRLRIWRAEAIDAETSEHPGTVVATGRSGIDVATAGGVLRLLEIQAPGGRAISANAYLRAHNLDGTRFTGGR